jgi:hypothetical protein
VLKRPGEGPPEKWRAIGSAFDDTAKTVRLCVILLVLTVPWIAVALIMR